MSSQTVSPQAREMAKAVLRELGSYHARGEEIIGQALEFYATVLAHADSRGEAYRAGFDDGKRAKFDEILRGFVGSHLMLLVSEGRTQEEAIRFVEEILAMVRTAPSAIPSLNKKLDAAATEAATEIKIASATRPPPKKDEPS